MEIGNGVESIGDNAFGGCGDAYRSACNEKLRCDKFCGSDYPKSCNPICGEEGCTVEALNKLDCPGNEDCQECPNSASALVPWSSITSALLFTVLAVNLYN